MPWYYPSHGIGSDNEDTTANYTAIAGNWGRKRIGDARWVRKGKMAAWGPNYEEWEVSEHLCPPGSTFIASCGLD